MSENEAFWATVDWHHISPNRSINQSLSESKNFLKVDFRPFSKQNGTKKEFRVSFPAGNYGSESIRARG